MYVYIYINIYICTVSLGIYIQGCNIHSSDMIMHKRNLPSLSLSYKFLSSVSVFHLGNLKHDRKAMSNVVTFLPSLSYSHSHIPSLSLSYSLSHYPSPFLYTRFSLSIPSLSYTHIPSLFLTSLSFLDHFTLSLLKSSLSQERKRIEDKEQ